MIMKKYICKECGRQFDVEYFVLECEFPECQSEDIEYLGSYRPFD